MTQRGALQTHNKKMMASLLYMQSRVDCESSRMPIAQEKPAALFSLGSEEPGNQFESSIFKNADPSNLGRSLIEAIKIICPVKRDLNL